jgi:SAM-dependent methyltransferase
VFAELGITVIDSSVLDYGFGGGDILASFPTSCRVTGVDISTSAVAAARTDRRFSSFASSTFAAIPENDFESILPGPYDIVVSSHVLEHVHDDTKLLKTLFQRLRPGGTLAIYVPIEEADYISFHVSNYSVQSIATTVRNCGFELCHVEGSLQINGHLWKLLTIPSRRRWPVLGPTVDALRQATLSAIPYRLVRFLDRSLHLLGFGARQALVIARRPHE